MIFFSPKDVFHSEENWIFSRITKCGVPEAKKKPNTLSVAVAESLASA